MRLELDRRDQSLVPDNQQIPSFFGPEPAWEIDPPLGQDILFRHSVQAEYLAYQIDKPIHLRTAGHRGACARIPHAVSGTLPRNLSPACFPETLNRFAYPLVKIIRDHCRTTIREVV